MRTGATTSADPGLSTAVGPHDINRLGAASPGAEYDQAPVRGPAWALVAPFRGQLRMPAAINIYCKYLKPACQTCIDDLRTVRRPGRIDAIAAVGGNPPDIATIGIHQVYLRLAETVRNKGDGGAIR